MRSREDRRTPAMTRASSSSGRSGVMVLVEVSGMGSASLHGAHDLDAVALAEGRLRPLPLSDDAPVECDGNALRALEAGLLGLDVEQGLDVARLALAGQAVDGELHA